MAVPVFLLNTFLTNNATINFLNGDFTLKYVSTCKLQEASETGVIM